MPHRNVVWLLITALVLLVGCVAQEPPAGDLTPATVETAAPTHTPLPLYDYGRDRAGEFVYRLEGDEHFHEIECPLLYGELTAVLYEQAITQGLTPCPQCREAGRVAVPEFPYNAGFERTMQVKIKANLTDSEGSHDILYITTGDEAFDLNNLFVNTPVRLLYKELGIDPKLLTMYAKAGGSTYHNALCEAAPDVTVRDVFTLEDVFAKRMSACRTCNPPTQEYYTLPMDTPDGMHFYYANPRYIRRVLAGTVLPTPEMNIDMERALGDYYK